MKIVNCKIEIPDGFELVDEMPRFPKKGEDFLISGDKPFRASFNITTEKYFIVRKVWQWPEWLLAEWICKHESGCWTASTKEPILVEDKISGWVIGIEYSSLREGIINFDPPPCDDWKLSKRRNPKFGEKDERTS